MALTAQMLVESDDNEERRGAEREAILVQAGFRKAGYHGTHIDVSDISTTGCKIDSPMNLGTGTKVWIKLPGLSSIEAAVIWANGFEAGCEFSAPFHQAVLDNLLARYRAAA